MPIAVRCRSCGRPYNLADRFAGQVVRCKDCDGAIEVPSVGRRLRPIAAPRCDAAFIAPPADPLSQPWPAPLPAAPSLPRLAPRRKKKSSPVLLAAIGAAGGTGLVVLAVIVCLMLPTRWPTLASNAPAPESTPVTFTGSYQSVAPSASAGPVTAPMHHAASSPGTFSGAGATSNARQFEGLVQKLLAALQGLNAVLSQVFDGPSARRQADQVVAKYHELLDLDQQLKAAAARITREEDRRLESTYGTQLTFAVEQLKGHALRIRQIQQVESAFGGRLPFEDLQERMGFLHGPRHGPGVSSSTPFFHPPTPPSFQRPAPHSFQPPPAPSFQPPRAPVAGPMRPPLNHGLRGPGAMHGRRGR